METKGFEIIKNILVSSFRFIGIPMFRISGHCTLFSSLRAETIKSNVYIRQIVHLKTVAALKGLITILLNSISTAAVFYVRNKGLLSALTIPVGMGGGLLSNCFFKTKYIDQK